jgi:Lrp/AsnC family transcriptional regulator, leucine-responsive regulatory protein
MKRIQEQLDDVDRKLVLILQRDARRSTAAIARDLNLSRTAIQARIARMENDGVIRGYSADLSPHIGGNLSAIVALAFDTRPCSLVLDVVLKWPEVIRVYSVAGELDAILIVSVPTTQHLSEFADRLLMIDGMRSAATTIVLSERRG